MLAPCSWLRIRHYGAHWYARERKELLVVALPVTRDGPGVISRYVLATRMEFSLKHLLSLILLAGTLTACTSPSSGGTGPLEVDLTATRISKTAPFEVGFTAAVRNAQGHDLTYTWDYGDLTDAVTGSHSATRTYLHPGTYTVNVQANDGKTSARDSIVINVLEPRYYGTWIWVAQYSDGSFYRGALNITLAAEDGDGFTDISVGVASIENSDGSGGGIPYGFGLIGTYTDSGVSALSTALVDDAAAPMLVGIDYDNRIGAEFDGDPSFYGEGRWINVDGTQDVIEVGLRKDSKEPLFAPNPNYDPTMPAARALTTNTLSASSLSRPSADMDQLERMGALLAGEGESLPLP